MKLLWISILIIILNSCVEEGDISPASADQWLYFDKGDGLVDDQVTTLFEDSRGHIWIGTSDGLSEWDGDSFTNYTTADGLLDNQINDIAEDRDGDLWVGTPEGVNVLIDDVWYYLIAFQGVQVYGLLETEDQNMLVGTVGYGAVEYNLTNNTISFFYYDPNCASCNIVYIMLLDSEGNYWMGTENGVKRIDNNSVDSFTTSNGLSGNVVSALAEDAWGNIWVGTFDGRTVSRITNNDVTQVNLLNSYTVNWVWDIAADDQGTLWISTALAGLYKYDGAFMRKDFENLPDEYVSSLMIDNNNNLWIGTLFDGLIMHTPEMK